MILHALRLRDAIVTGLACLLTHVAAASAVLVNGGFEDGNGVLVGWTTFNNGIPNVVATTTTPHTGSYVAKVFGGFNGTPNYSGLQQNLTAWAGQNWQASCFVRHNSSDSLAGTTNRLILKIEFYRVAGGVWGTSDMLAEHALEVLSASSPVNQWLDRTLQATAPANTVEARITLVFDQKNNGPGAALVDDVSFSADGGPTPTGWNLVWQDEFDGPSIDSSKWRVEDLHLNKNSELQYYTPQDVYIENGKLVLRSQARSFWGYDDNGAWRHFDYTSGLVETKNLFATKYGRIEVRAKLPGTQGIWPAHWMMSPGGQWPPEIDIMEIVGHETNRIWMSHHWGVWPSVQTFTQNWAGPDFTQDFHTFAIEWWPDRITWFVDGVARAAHMSNIPQEPLYIILNTAVGGSWPGNPDGTTVFPQYHFIDYVRVYAPDESGSPPVDVHDGTATTARVDGQVGVGEYVGSRNGINAGFGDRAGQNSVFYFDSSALGHLNFAFKSMNAWPMPSSFGAVIYIDSEPGGYASTVVLQDVADQGRRLASGKTASGAASNLYFAPGFAADYAVCIAPEQMNIYRLGTATHTWINGADLGAQTDLLGGHDVIYRIGSGTPGNKTREMGLRLSQIGVASGEKLDMVVTYVNGDTAYRTNEFVGVAPGNTFDGSNPGFADVSLKIADFIRFTTVPSQPCGIPADMNCDGIIGPEDLEPFVTALIAPDLYVSSHPGCPLCAGDLNGDGVCNGSDVQEFVHRLVIGG
jgi:beta-glucanase (GH16 family)